MPCMQILNVLKYICHIIYLTVDEEEPCKSKNKTFRETYRYKCKVIGWTLKIGKILLL